MVKYGVKGSATILYWVKAYQKYGIKGVTNYPTKHIYTMNEHLNILNWMKMTKSSYPEIATYFEIRSPSLIWNWQHQFELYGINGLATRRDLLKMSKKTINNSKSEKLKKLKQ